MSKQFTTEEVKQHNKKEDCWIILDGKVYDVTKFLEDHPGGEEVVIDCAGRDATSDFDDVGHSDEANTMRAEYEIGVLAGATQKPKPVPNSAPGPKKEEGNNMIFIGAILLLLAILAYYISQ
jgi:cytochrome b involved in lipid metabolism